MHIFCAFRKEGSKRGNIPSFEVLRGRERERERERDEKRE
jgi:hypothetical protein